jgi:rubrerythrin
VLAVKTVQLEGTVIYRFNANEIFQMAIDIEENGRLFYEKAQGLVDNPEVKDMFAKLANDEIEHKKKFISLKAQLPESAKVPTVWDPDNELDQYLRMMAGMNVFRSDVSVQKALDQVNNTTDALELAIQFEKDSVVFYLTMQDATEEKRGRELIGQLVQEEREHLRRLTFELARHSG